MTTGSAETVSGDDVLRDVIRVAADAIGDRLVAGYALGSLAHGGFAPAASDVDVALILADPIQPSDPVLIQQIGDAVRAIGSPLHARTSIFWGSPESLRGDGTDGRFPPLDRLCLSEHGRLLIGVDIRAGLQPPGHAELVAAGARFAVDLLAEAVVAAAADPAGLLANGVRLTTKLVLFPARFLFTADTGLEGTNDAAVQHYSTHYRGTSADLVAAAFAWRTAEPTENAAALLRDGFVPLYDCYLADHIGRLDSLSEPDLADRFRAWRSRLPSAG